MPFFRSLILALALSGPVAGLCDEAEELKASIVVRCIYSAGEFGNQLVDICVKADLAAAQALRNYPPQSAVIVNRCTARLQDDGWERIKMCADGDIAAEAALSSLGAAQADLIASCRAKAGRFGSVKVKACVEDALKPGR